MLTLIMKAFNKYVLTYYLVNVFIIKSIESASTSITDKLESCKIPIIVSVFSGIGLCVLVTLCFCLTYSMVKKKKKRQNKAAAHKLNNIKGRRNKVFEEDGDLKDEDEYSNGRKRQDSGFVASSNESIVPLPDMYATTGPRRSPSMPDLSTSTRNGYDQQDHEDVFPSSNTSSKTNGVNTSSKTNGVNPKPQMVSTGTSTDDLLQQMSSSSITDNPSVKACDSVEIPRKSESVIIQKRSFNCTGIDFGIGGIYVKEIDLKEIFFKKGILSIGDEVLAINDYPVNGLSDMEAFSFFAKSGPDVKLKVIKAGFLAKAEGMSTCSNDFAMSDISSVNDVEVSPGSETVIKTAPANQNRLPRVIADANNLSHDMSNNPTYKPTQSHNATVPRQPSSISSNGSSTVHQNNFPYINGVVLDGNYSDGIQAPKPSSNGGDGNPHFQSYHDIFGVSGQEITRLLVANPSLFMEFLTCVKARERGKVEHSSSRCSSDTECCAHSRSVSNENGKHCRHCSSSEQCQHNRRSSGSDTPHHNRNTSSENSSKLSRVSYDEHDNTKKFSRSSWDEQMRTGILYTSGEAAGSSPQIFTIDSYNKNQLEHNKGVPQTQIIPGEKDYHMLIKQASVEHPYQQQPVDVNGITGVSNQHPVVVTNGHSSHLISDNVVVQRGYNNDYIIPVNGNYSNIPSGYAKSLHRNKDNSPARRTSPVVFTTQTFPRFPGANIANSEVTPVVNSDYRQQLSNSPQSSMSGPQKQNGHTRKPPPEYTSLARPSNDPIPTEINNREYDQEFMRKMTQKYSEPRFRKDPPPYSSSHTQSGNDKVFPSYENVVFRRRSDDRTRTGSRSRPHSYTETGILVPGLTDDNTVQMQMKTLQTDEKRKHPKRTHSMPAVKYAEMRPVAAQAFLSINHPSPQNSMSLQQQQQLQIQIQQDQQQQQQLQQQLEQKLYEQRILEQQILEQKQQQQLLQHQQQMQQHQHQQSQQQQQLLEQQQRQQQLQQQQKQQQLLEHQLLEHQRQQQQRQQQLFENQMLEQHQHQQFQQQQQNNPQPIQNNKIEQTPKKLRMRQRAQDNINRRKSIDSGTLRQLAEEMKENPSLGGEFPILSQLLVESQMAASERRAQGLYRYKSTEAIYSQF